MTEIKWQDVFYFADCAIYAGAVLFTKKTGIRERFRLRHVRAYWLVAVVLLILNAGLAEAIRPQLFTRTFDRELLVKNIGPYGYELYDLFLQSRAAAQKAMAGGSGLEEVRLYTKKRFAGPDPAFYGIAKGRNVIVVSLESTQNFVLGAKIGGQEITPFLNRLAKDSYFFSEIYLQTGQGKTSDAEFLAENALYPLGRGAVFFTHPDNTFHTMAKRLASLGYDTAVFHANQKSFWNRDKMYRSFGYRRFYAAPDYDIRDENSAGWGLKDMP